jgi:hypothetical protein
VAGRIQGTYTYQSGFPVTFSSDAFYLGGPIALSKNERTLNKWFNTSAFISNANGTPSCPNAQGVVSANANCATPADHLRTLPLRFGDVRIDAINNVDAGLRKDIHIREGMKVQLRMEFINLLNHPLFPGPAVNPGAASFGVVSASNQNNYARRAQLMAKFIF